MVMTFLYCAGCLVDMANRADKAVTVALNFDGGRFADMAFSTLSSRLIWVLPALWLLYRIVFVRRYGLWQVCAVFMGLALTVALCDQMSASVFKPLFMRLRPSHADGVRELLHYVGTYRGGLYGFVSSHAANAFGAAMYASLLLKKKAFTVFIFCFAAAVGYSRIYLGVHYLGDVIGGAVLGSMLGLLVFRCMKFVSGRFLSYLLYVFVSV